MPKWRLYENISCLSSQYFTFTLLHLKYETYQSNHDVALTQAHSSPQFQLISVSDIKPGFAVNTKSHAGICAYQLSSARIYRSMVLLKCSGKLTHVKVKLMETYHLNPFWGKVTKHFEVFLSHFTGDSINAFFKFPVDHLKCSSLFVHLDRGLVAKLARKDFGLSLFECASFCNAQFVKQ